MIVELSMYNITECFYLYLQMDIVYTYVERVEHEQLRK